MIDKLLEYLQSAQRPVILMGAGAREAAPDIIAFAERFNVPIETTWNAIDLIEWEHRLFVGRPGIVATRGSNLVVQECDLLLAIGARLDVQTVAWDYNKIAPKAKKVIVDIDISESMKIPNLDIFIHQDAGEFIKELGVKDLQMKYYGDVREWSAHCRELKRIYKLEGDTVSYQLMNKLSDELTADDVLIIGTSCMTVHIFCAGFRNKKGQKVLLAMCGLGSMGVVIPMAIGVALASGRHVVCVDGDGSFMQNIQELEVVRRLDLPITFYVVNNGGYASIRNTESRAFGRLAGSDESSGLTLPDIRKIAEAFGCGDKVIVIDAPHDEVLKPRVVFDGRGNLGDMWPYKENA